MKVNLKCFAGLAEQYACDYHTSTVPELPDGSGVRDVTQMMGITEDEVNLIFVNGKISNADRALRNGDNLTLVPATGGM